MVEVGSASGKLPEQQQIAIKELDKKSLALLTPYLSSIGNSEAKALTILGFHNTSEIVDGNELNKRVIALTRGVWRQHPFATESYCQTSFDQIGLVTKEVIDDKLNHFGYMLTQRGLQEGQRIAAFLLLKGYQYSLSLYDLYGSTNTFKDRSRSPENSFALLYGLAMSQNPLTRSQLIQATGIDSTTVTQNLKRLNKNGLVIYRRASADESGYAQYSLNESSPDQPPKPSIDIALTRDVWAILQSRFGQYLSFHDIDSLIKSTPDLVAKYGHRQRLGTNISNILGLLKKQGLIDRSELGEDIRSHAELPEVTRRFVTDVFPRLISFMEGDSNTIKEFDEAKQIVLSDSDEGEKIRTIEMNRAKETSPSSPLNTRSAVERVSDVEEYLRLHGDVRPSKISEDLGITSATVRRALHALEREHIIAKNRDGRAVYYTLVKKH